MLTGASVFLKALSDAGITHVFCNWGSDHPAFLEELERQRAVGEGDTRPRVITCPNEMVALSVAQGFGQATGRVAGVIVHVDVGTQGMAGAVHNACRGRTPVLIFAGANAYSPENEVRGGRNEWMMWTQDIPDQPAIVRQYMRHTAELYNYRTLPGAVNRALQIAVSEPKGPVYLWARREVMEEEVPPSFFDNQQKPSNKWPKIEPTALSPSSITRLASALAKAKSPLIITSHIGQKGTNAVSALQELSSLLAIPICVTCPSAVNISFSHPYFVGLTYLKPGTHTPHLEKADVVLVVESDAPWVPAHVKPSPDAKVFVLDSGDPLRLAMGHWHVDAEMVCQADSEVVILQVVDALRKNTLSSAEISQRAKMVEEEHNEWVRNLEKMENDFTSSSSITLPNILKILRNTLTSQSLELGVKTLILNEAITGFAQVWTHLQPEKAGSIINSGGTALGWALGAAVGAHLGSEQAGKGYELVVAIVGDGTFLFGIPSSAYWMARRYNTPFLTIVLNNGGWQSPKLSMLGVYPEGHGSNLSATGDRLSVGFGPHNPDYSQIAVAASGGWAWGKRVGGAGTGEANLKAREVQLESVISDAVNVVVKERRCAVVECVLESI